MTKLTVLLTVAIAQLVGNCCAYRKEYVLPMEKVYIYCEIYPQKSIQILKNGQTLILDVDYMIWEFPHLIIVDPRPDRDEGNYRCGSREYIIKSNYKSKPSHKLFTETDKIEKKLHHKRNILKHLIIVFPVLLIALVMIIIGQINSIYHDSSLNYAKLVYMREHSGLWRFVNIIQIN